MSTRPSRPDVLRIGNCSGFFGDRTHAAREMVNGGPIDVLTGDWLAELTMYILHKTRERSGGYARTFLRELEEVLPTCIERGITVVSNAGGLQPEALAAAVGELARRQGLDVHVASVSGDDITSDIPALRAQGEAFVNLDTGEHLPADAPVVTANAYLRARPIADALAAGAQVVVTGRVTDAALVVGPALHAFGWSDGDLDAIAGAVVAGHVIECGAQCCGGNYAFFEEVPNRARIGFPLAELRADGSSVITKHPGTGGMVTVGTVTAQLLYEIGGPRYLSPDAVARFDTIDLSQEGVDRVRIAPVRGEAPPSTLKVTANLDAGWRNAMTLALTGAQVAEKARFAAEAVWAGLPGGAPDSPRHPRTSRGTSRARAWRSCASPCVATTSRRSGGPSRAPSSKPVSRATPARSSPRRRRGRRGSPATGRPRSAPKRCHRTSNATGVRSRPHRPLCTMASQRPGSRRPKPPGRNERRPRHGGDTVEVPLWVLIGARSGDKGGDANVGLWADDDAVAEWLHESFSVEVFRTLLPEVGPCEVSRYPLPNLRAVNFVVHGVLGWGVASNLRLDTQAKGLGELLRSRRVRVPAELLASGPAAARLAAS